MDPVFAFPLTLPPTGSRRLLRALHEQLRGAILDGRLKPGLRLPATRALAAAFGISRNTAVAAYDLLVGEGYVEARAGSGIYVAAVMPQRARRTAKTDPTHERRLAPFWRDPPPTPRGPPPPVAQLRFELGVPDPRRFPFDVWRRLAARALRASSRGPASYADAQGQPALRDAIARHVSFARAVSCGGDDIVVTAGAQQAFDLVARILVTPGRTVVAMENPGYPPARAAFAAAGATIVPVRVDAEGLVVDEIPANARIVYVTPSHQFPLGVALSTRRRTALLEFAQRSGAVVVEDDYDGEFRYGERPLDALQTLDRDDGVFYIGTFSKSLFPSLRLGFVVAPVWARPALVAAKRCVDWHCATHAQDTLAAFIAEGHLARHVRRMQQTYAQRRRELLAGLEPLAPRLTVLPSSAGLHLSALVRNAAAVAQAAAERGVGVRALAAFHVGKGAPSGLVFGYGTIEEARIGGALAVLGEVLAR
jgi:GntR family transcriptional regulator/MocR family aminotransferase